MDTLGLYKEQIEDTELATWDNYQQLLDTIFNNTPRRTVLSYEEVLRRKHECQRKYYADPLRRQQKREYDKQYRLRKKNEKNNSLRRGCN